MTYCLVEVSASQSSRKCSMSSVVFALHISQFVYPSMCLFSMFGFKVPVLALNKVVGDGTRFTLLFVCELSLL